MHLFKPFKFRNKIPKDYTFILLGGFYQLFHALPFFILGQDSFIHVWDNLTNEFIYIILLIKNGLALSVNQHAMVPQIMTGIERNFFRSGLNITFLLFKLFPPFWAYIINMLTVRFIGFVGLYLLLEKYLNKDRKTLNFLISILYSSIYIYSIVGLYSMGIPLFLLLILNIMNSEKVILNLFLLLLYNAYSMPYLSFISYLFIFISLIIYYLVTDRQNFINRQWKILAFTMFAFFCSLIVFEQNLVISLLNKRLELSHRVEFKHYFSLTDSIKRYKELLFDVQMHVGRFSTKITHLLLVISILLMVFKKEINYKPIITYLLLHIVLLFSAFYPIVYITLGKLNGIFLAYDGSRIYSILPTLFFVLFTFCIVYIYDFLSGKSWILSICIVGAIISFQLVKILKMDEEFYSNFLAVYNNKPNVNTSYNEYFSIESFNKIKTSINKPTDSYRVACVGFDPSVALFNNMYTVDGYSVNYLLSYKKEFREVIRHELDKNAVIKRFYNDWGNCCYLFSNDIFVNNYNPSNIKDDTYITLELQYDLLKKLGAQYIISIVKIKNDNLILYCTVDSNSYNKIYVYSIN